MPVQYTDDQIAELIAEPKPLPGDFHRRMLLMPKRGHKEQQLDLQGMRGGEFRIILRQSEGNALDFSVILACVVARSHRAFRLRRYNGKNHEHTNRIEKEKFYDFHIHTATERYQAMGEEEDAFGEPTGRYGAMNGAVDCLLHDCGFSVPPPDQPALFGGP